MRSLIIASAMAFIATTITANPVDFTIPLPRQDDIEDIKYGYLSFCNTCTSTLTCVDLRTMTWGKHGSWEGGCEDDVAVFEDGCSTQDREVDTPLGKGEWKPVNNCEDYNSPGDVKGVITGVGDASFTYKCWNHGETYSETCLIQTWACNVELGCRLITKDGEVIPE